MSEGVKLKAHPPLHHRHLTAAVPGWSDVYTAHSPHLYVHPALPGMVSQTSALASQHSKSWCIHAALWMTAAQSCFLVLEGQWKWNSLVFTGCSSFSLNQNHYKQATAQTDPGVYTHTHTHTHYHAIYYGASHFDTICQLRLYKCVKKKKSSNFNFKLNSISKLLTFMNIIFCFS